MLFRNCSCVCLCFINESNDTGCVNLEHVGQSCTESFFHRMMHRNNFMGSVNPKQSLIGETMLCLMCYLARRKYKGEVEKKEMSLAIAVGTALLIPPLCYLCYLICRKLKAKRNGKAQANKDQTMKRDLKIFDFQIIAAATEHFSPANRLGQGGFGPVYKGKLLDGQEIAIKRLSKSSGQGIVEFKNEAKLIAKLQHTNLVRRLGCSLQKGERLLVYEYVPNKSLDSFIFGMSLFNIYIKILQRYINFSPH
ncbi:hypothetical protein CUMW_282180 [Citrus unshiu]|uniref:non-specific serine/threonine protein kinase n=1 Tax=Citrus unshiu TaxID=55188 RepID=A0A2H5N0J9_CITUN|nr:hypothetical protein CUMW_282180 [Citrus unshiu]